MQDGSSFQSRSGSDMKFNWKSSFKKSPKSKEECESSNQRNSSELNSSGWKHTREVHNNGSCSPEGLGMPLRNKSKVYKERGNNLPPVIVKTAQCFYKGKNSVKDSPSDEFIKIEKPKIHSKKHANGSIKRSSKYLHEYPSEENVKPDF